MINWKVEYICDWGYFSHRYDYLDRMMNRPIHRDMSVAAPWAKMRITFTL